MRGKLQQVLLAGAICLISGHVWAQSYRCTSNGSAYFSDRPCGPGASSKLAAIGPAPEQPQRRPDRSARPMPLAPDYLSYLSGPCARINDAIRTAPARGVSESVVADLHREYQAKCGEDERNAREQLSKERGREAAQAGELRASADREKALARSKADHCAAMHDVLQLKRRRIDTLSPKEVTALAQLEESFNARCL